MPSRRIAIGVHVLISVLGSSAWSQEVKIPTGTTLRIDLEKPVRIRVGGQVIGHLSQPVYLVDREIIPVGTRVTGHIRAVGPGLGKDRVVRLLAADFTPPHVPKVVFERLELPSRDGLPGGTITIEAPAEITDARNLPWEQSRNANPFTSR